MQQKNSTKQSRSKTRVQRKRERIQMAFMVVAMIILWAMALTMMVKAWGEHPAEQPVSYATHMEYVQTIGGDSDA